MRNDMVLLKQGGKKNFYLLPFTYNLLLFKNGG